MRLPKTKLSVGLAVGLLIASGRVFAYPDDHNPVGSTGTFDGVVTTGGSYNVLTHNATRQIDDLVVPGALGKYGLKMTRYYNSRDIYGYGMSMGWSYEYVWSYDVSRGKVRYPDGNVYEEWCADPGVLGVSDGWEQGGQTFRLADGGTVVFGPYPASYPIQIIDPYGLTTNITYATDGTWMNVTEPGGRYLHFIYDGVGLTRVEAHGHGDANVTDWVNYTYTSQPTGGTISPTAMMLTSVDYSDGTSASYTYQWDNADENVNRGSIRVAPLLSGANDVRFHGPMRRIGYEFRQTHPPHGDLFRERYWDGIAGHEQTGSIVSTIDPPLPDPLETYPTFPTAFTETRGDGPQRSFTYSPEHLHRFDGEVCPTPTQPPYITQQFLLSYTDFQANTTTLAYDSNWYINSVTNGNNQTTTYLRGPAPDSYPGPRGTGEIQQITHPGGAHIDYQYQTEALIGGHYVSQVTNELGKAIIYTRDQPPTPSPTVHLVTRIDYPSDAQTPASSEVFTYNSFGQVLTHQLRNGAWEKFKYDSRGLLTDQFNPKQAGVPLDTDPHTHFTYYTSGTSTDRVLTKTFPVNVSGYAATETYEYDNGGSGRGLITKITHADGHYGSMGYDSYGNKLWEENELRQRTTYTYDDYNRVLTVKNPLLNILSYTYVPPSGGSPYSHTTSNADTATTPTGVVTKNVYDANWRKTSTTLAYGTTLAATTTFAYDNVGNPTTLTDPLSHQTQNTYDARDRKITTTAAYGTSLAQTTTMHYDAASNVASIDRPDGTTETKTYDAVNRVKTDTVPQTATINLTTTFTYNPSGTLYQVTDAKGDVTTFGYDASDRKTLMTYPGAAGTQQWAYDDVANLKNRTTVGGEIQSYQYDNLNRRIGMTWSNAADSATFGYDLASRLTNANNASSTVTRGYDAAGHLSVDTQYVTGMPTPGVSVHYAYDDDGKVNRMYATGDGLASGDYDFTYSYDAMGRFEKILITPSGALFQYHYDAASNETERDNLFNSVNQYTPRDALNRIYPSWDVKKGATTLEHESYTYDAMNRITQVAPLTGSADVFTYYKDGELNTANLPNLNQNPTYNIDKMGNRTSVVNKGITTTYTTNPINEYTAVTGDTLTNGSEHQISALNGVTYGYINDEHLTSATFSTGNGTAGGSTTYSMAYDALGRSVTRSLTGGPTTYYIYDGEKPILEYDGALPGTTVIGVNIYGKGIDEILERVALGQGYFPQQNHEGSVRLLTATDGTAVERYRYDAYGAPTFYTGSWGALTSTAYDNRFLFTGREYTATYRGIYNASLNFYEYRARAYSPALGRFMSEDPKGYAAGDYNLFRYVGNDPLDHTDPMGLEQTVPEQTGITWTPGAVWRMEVQKDTIQESISQNAMAFDRGSMNQRPAGMKNLSGMSGVYEGTGAASFLKALQAVPTHSITSLKINGHADQVGQNLGKNRDSRDGLNIIGQKVWIQGKGLGKGNGVLFDEGLAAKFAEGSRIYLNGCHTGQESTSLASADGLNIAQAMSRAIPQAHVYGSATYVEHVPWTGVMIHVPFSVRGYVNGERVSGPMSGSDIGARIDAALGH